MTTAVTRPGVPRDGRSVAFCAEVAAERSAARSSTAGAPETPVVFTGTTPSRSRNQGRSCADLVTRLDVDVQSLQQREPPELDNTRQPVDKRGQCRRRLPVQRHLVAVREVAEERLPGLGDVLRMLQQGIRVDVALPDLALGSVVAQEPVVAECLRVLLPRVPHHLRGLLPESVELAVADLHSRHYLEHGVL